MISKFEIVSLKSMKTASAAAMLLVLLLLAPLGFGPGVGVVPRHTEAGPIRGAVTQGNLPDQRIDVSVLQEGGE